MHIIALATCHNRHSKTLASLADLYAQDLPANVSLAVTLVDDGSIDGTTDAVQATYPSVHIIRGDGNLFWAGGMRYGWEQWVKHQRFDALLVFNDDIRLDSTALQDLIETSQYAQRLHNSLIVVSGAFTDMSEHVITYGGYRHSSKWHKLRFSMVTPTGAPCQIDTLNMNCALISSEALHEVGFLSDYFQHIGADTEFGLKLRRAGGTVWLTPNTIGKCERNVDEIALTGNNYSAREKFRRMSGVKGEQPSIRARYFRDHGGIFWPVLWAGPYLRILFSLISEVFSGKR